MLQERRLNKRRLVLHLVSQVDAQGEHEVAQLVAQLLVAQLGAQLVTQGAQLDAQEPQAVAHLPPRVPIAIIKTVAYISENSFGNVLSHSGQRFSRK